MSETTFTCPRCFQTASVRPGVRFCPRCGLADAAEAAMDTSPLELNIRGRAYRVLDRIAIGSISTVYRCRFEASGRPADGVFKIARDARTNDLLANEAVILRRLHASADAGRFSPFLPAVVESLAVGDDGPPRQANILRMHEAIALPDDLYTLAEVRGHYPAGLDPKDAAWIWRRLLSILGFVHAQGIVHAAVLPMHVLIEPREHKLMLIDWCSAVADASAACKSVLIIAGGHTDWYKREGFVRQPPTPALDIAFGARCMIELLGGDPVRAAFPPALDPALQRYFGRCLNGGSGGRQEAWKLLEDFDHLIEAMWGPRRFRVLELPTEGKPRERS